MMNREDLFDLCSSERMKYVYAEAWVKVVKSDNGYKIEEIDWTLTKLGYYDEKDLKDEIMEIEVPDLEEEDGFYVLKCLFSVEYDSDDYRSWTYLTPEIFEFDFQVSIEESERRQEEFDQMIQNFDGRSDLDDLFSIFKKETE